MAPLTPPPKIKLSRLRDIGWSIWDPIGLLAAGKKWDDEDCRGFADEYDRYLIKAAGDLRRGSSDTEVVDYLIQIEAEYMGLGLGLGIHERAQSVVDAIHPDEQLWTYSDMQTPSNGAVWHFADYSPSRAHRRGRGEVLLGLQEISCRDNPRKTLRSPQLFIGWGPLLARSGSCQRQSA